MLHRRLRIELFGEPRVRLGEDCISFFGKRGALLALLALAPELRRTREELASLIWSDNAEPEVADNRLRNLLSRVRTEIKRGMPGGEEVILADNDAIWLNRHLDPFIDAVEFDRLFAAKRKAQTVEERVELLRRAVELYTGPFARLVYVDAVVATANRYKAAIEEANSELLRLDGVSIEPRVETISIPEPATIATAVRESIVPDPVVPAPTTDLIASHAPLQPVPHFRRTARGVGLMSVAAAGLWLWSRRPEPPPDEVIQKIEQLSQGGSPAETRDERNGRMREESDECLALAEVAWKAAYKREEQDWLPRMMRVDVPMQQSLRWLLANDSGKALELAGILSRYWWIANKPSVARSFLEPALERSSGLNGASKARALLMHATCLMDEGSKKPQPVRPRRRNEDLQALSELHQANAIYTRCGEIFGQAETLRMSGHVLHAMEDEGEAEKCFNESLPMFRDNGYACSAAHVYWCLGLIPHRGASPGTELLRQADLFLTSVELQQKQEAGNDYYLTEAFGALSDSIDAMLKTLNGHPRPEFAHQLSCYLDVAGHELDRQIQRGATKDIMDTRKRIARVAILVNRRPTAIVQLGCLIGPFGAAMPVEAQVRLAGAYLQYISEAQRPPFTGDYVESYVRSQVKANRLSRLNVSSLIAQGRKMTLEDAIAEATR